MIDEFEEPVIFKRRCWCCKKHKVAFKNMNKAQKKARIAYLWSKVRLAIQVGRAMNANRMSK